MLPDDLSERETNLNVPEPDIVPDSGDVHHHHNELNDEYDMTQSTMGKQQLDHSSVFITIMSSYMLPDGAGFRSLKEVAQGIEHYETYSEFCLTIGKSTLGRYHLYGIQIHMNCQFCVSFGFKHGSVVITMKNRILIHSGMDQSTSMKDGRNRKKHSKGQLDESCNLASSTHDDEPKPRDSKKTTAGHDGVNCELQHCMEG